MQLVALFFILLMSSAVVAQSKNDDGFAVARKFLELVNAGKLSEAELMTQSGFVVAFEKTYGAQDQEPVKTALERLAAADHKVVKDLSFREDKGTMLVFVQTLSGGTVIDVFEFAMMRSRNSWRIFSWRVISPPMQRPNHLRDIFKPPVSYPITRPCPRCG